MLANVSQLPPKQLEQGVVAARALNWKNDPFARGAYSYAMPQTRQALAAIEGPGRSWILLAGEAFYRGRDMGTVEAQGLATARSILAD